ncbi:TetR/AcrR family transcriptional regulator [Kineosporia rhizophila]|uniref:TetR/AcrR family transcriptional regulator n=1 Tax=Kineosporia TaxID=49184 RepID=UPI001E2A8511|nr:MULTISPECIES: TetR/AcrR family transcriptional regulator [Kineosporia]MCE0535011.1 TetR/AcrR family transcriptional regulator [Kineosporia rhizophila]GLY14705.1 TetR family transcriptional regulator [Kineosporia sp. NBRC 101677]
MEQRLVEVGVEVLESGGPEHLGLREIARRAGVSHGAPRRHFPTHRLLLVAIARAGLVDLTAELSSALPPAGPADERLIAVANAYVGFAERRPEMFRLMFRHDILADRQTSRSGSSLREIWLPLLAEVAQVIETGFPAGPDAGERALLIWSHVHGIATLATGLTLEPAGFEGRVATLVERAVRAQLTSP